MVPNEQQKASENKTHFFLTIDSLPLFMAIKIDVLRFIFCYDST